MQKLLLIPPLLASIFLSSQACIAAGTVDDWIYPGLQRVGSAGEFRAGDVTHSRHFHYFTTDAFPDVITWYVRKHGVKGDDDLLKNLKGKSAGQVEPLTGTIKDASLQAEEAALSLVIYDIAPNRAHVTIVKPVPDEGQAIVVSISADKSKTTVHFIQRLIER